MVNRQLTACVIALVLLTASCSSGDDAETPTTDASSESSVAWCEAYADVMAVVSLGATPERAQDEWVADVSSQLDDVAAGSPEPVAASVERMVTALQPAIETGDFSQIREVQDSPEYAEDADGVAAYVIDECRFARTAVTAIDYAYMADLTDVEPGYTALEFSNEGTEIHELFLVRIDDESTEPIEGILALPPDEAFGSLTREGVTLDLPSGSSVLFTDLQPGRYAILCLIPTGSTPDRISDLRAGRIAGPPHFTQGMVREFTVDG